MQRTCTQPAMNCRLTINRLLCRNIISPPHHLPNILKYSPDSRPTINILQIAIPGSSIIAPELCSTALFEPAPGTARNTWDTPHTAQNTSCYPIPRRLVLLYDYEYTRTRLVSRLTIMPACAWSGCHWLPAPTSYMIDHTTLSYAKAPKRTRCESIETATGKRRLFFAGAVARQSKERLPSPVMFGTIAGGENPRPGGQFETWHRCV